MNIESLPRTTKKQYNFEKIILFLSLLSFLGILSSNINFVYKKYKEDKYIVDYKEKTEILKKKYEKDISYLEYLKTDQFKESYAKENLSKKSNKNEKIDKIERVVAEEENIIKLSEKEKLKKLSPKEQWKNYFKL